MVGWMILKKYLQRYLILGLVLFTVFYLYHRCYVTVSNNVTVSNVKVSNVIKSTTSAVNYNYTTSMEPIAITDFQRLYMDWYAAYRKIHGPVGKSMTPTHWSTCPNVNRKTRPDFNQYCSGQRFELLEGRANRLEKDISVMNERVNWVRNNTIKLDSTTVNVTDVGHTMLSPLDCHYFPAVACLKSVYTIILQNNISSETQDMTSFFSHHVYYATTANTKIRQVLKSPKNTSLVLGLDSINVTRPLNWGTQENHDAWRFEPAGNQSVHEWKLRSEPGSVLSYVHLIEKAVVDDKGNVYRGKFKFAYHSCFRQNHLQEKLNIREKMQTVDEIFVLSIGFARKNYYHTMIQMLSRATLYKQFLNDNPNIFLHVRHTSAYQRELLHIMGIHNELLEGHVTASSIVYLPQSAGCAQHTVYTQHMRQHFTHYIKTNLIKHNSYKPILLLVKRQRRGLGNYQVIFNMLTSYARQYGLDLEEFSDDPVPSMNKTMELFHRARIIVAPHGAGLSNILFCQPATILIEVLLPTRNMYPCYQQLSHALGMRYHGIMAQKKCLETCFLDVDVEYLNKTVEYVTKTFFIRTDN